MRRKTLKASDIALLAGFVITFGVLFSFPQSAHALGLKENSIIEDSVIRLGDIFYGLDYNADKVIGPAPRPGQDMVLNARTLWRISSATNIGWRPADLTEEVVLSRAATLIDSEMIEEKLRIELEDRGAQGKFGIIFPSGTAEMILPMDQPDTFEITRLDFNPQRDYFTADLVAPSANNPIQRIRVKGNIERRIDVPVLKTSLSTGSVITVRDLKMVELPARQIKGEIILNPRELLGMAPRRVVFAGKPIKGQDIQAPQIIDRGEFVTMTYDNGFLQLTAQGKALENGAKGDVIRVVNMGSNQTIEAQITAQRQVVVTTF